MVSNWARRFISPHRSSPLIPSKLHGPSWSKCLNRQQIRSPDVSAPGSSGVLRGVSLRLGAAGDGVCLRFPLIGVSGSQRVEVLENLFFAELLGAGVQRARAGAATRVYPRAGTGRHGRELVRGELPVPLQDQVDGLLLVVVERPGA